VSAYPTPGLPIPGFNRHAAIPGAPLTGLRGSLEAPGLVASPVDERAQRGLGELRQALGLVGAVAGDIGQTARSIAIAQRERDAEAKALDQGHAAQAARTALPQIQADIAAGKFTIPQGQSIEAFVNEHFIDPGTDGMSDAFHEEYARIATPTLVREFVAKQVEIKDKARQENIQLLSERATAATLPATIRESVEEARRLYPEMTDTDLMASIVMPAAKSAASSGNGAQLEAAKAVLGDRFPAEVARLNAVYTDARAHQEARRNDDFTNTIADLYVKGQPFDQIRQSIRAYDGKIDAKLIDEQLQRVNQRERESLSNSATLSLKAALGAARSQMSSRMKAAILDGHAFAVQDQQIEGPDGQLHKIDADGVRMAAFQDEFARIAKTAPDPETAFAAQAELASRNGYSPPVWASTLSAGFVASTEQSLVKDPNAAMPAAAAEGFGIYKRLKAQAPGLLESMLPDAKARDFYETAYALQQLTQVGGDDQRALLTARLAMSSPIALASINPRDLANAADDIVGRFWGDDKNKTEIAGVLQSRAMPLIKLGIPPKEALSLVADQVRKSAVSLNGYSQVMTGVPDAIKRELPSISKSIAKAWSEKYGAAWSMDASDLTLRWGYTTKYLFLCDARTGIPVDGSAKKTAFSLADLLHFRDAQLSADQAAKDAATIKRQSEKMDAINSGYGFKAISDEEAQRMQDAATLQEEQGRGLSGSSRGDY